MKGKLYCIGVGPGDPELLTVKALRCIKKCPVLAVPQSRPGVWTAKQIVVEAAAVTEGIRLDEKEIITIDFPMVRDENTVRRAQATGARAIEERLDCGMDVALITLGCPTIYASSMYIHRMAAQDGYETEIIPGVPSFCAAAAALQTPLCEKDEPLLIIPGSRSDREDFLMMDGSKVIMKPSGPFEELKKDITAAGKINNASMVERCGLPGEKIYPSMADAAESPYFSVILVK